jgi:tRNA modification GTPase
MKDDIESNNEVLLTNVRHKNLVELSEKSLRDAADAYEGGMPLDFITIDIRDAANYLGEITGESVSEDVVQEIFHRFCVGK